MELAPADDLAHVDATAEEWVFAAWTPDGGIGAISGHRLLGQRAWYWAALAEHGRPLLHVTEWEIDVRPDPLIVKAHALWAEHICDAAMEQWTVANETYATALDDAGEALDRAYGVPTPIAFDLEWYATSPPHGIVDGYEQTGVVHGTIEVAGRPGLELAEVPAHRWHRWVTDDAPLPPLEVPAVFAHGGVRAPFAFPDGTSLDLVLTPHGWRSRPGRSA